MKKKGYFATPEKVYFPTPRVKKSSPIFQNFEVPQSSAIFQSPKLRKNAPAFQEFKMPANSPLTATRLKRGG